MALNKPQKMSLLLSTIKNVLAKSPFFSILPANILMIPLEMLADYTFSCPCDAVMNTKLTGLVFSAPAFYILALVLLYLRYVLSEKKKKGNEENVDESVELKKLNVVINALLYLFPPILWIMMLLLDGDYMACGKTFWKGEYVLDDKLKIKWCKPTELIPGRNETELQLLTLSFINKSQHDGYFVLLFYSICMVLLLLYCIYCYCCEKTNNPSNEDKNQRL